MCLFLEEEEWNVIFHCHKGTKRRAPCGRNLWTSASAKWFEWLVWNQVGRYSAGHYQTNLQNKPKTNSIKLDYTVPVYFPVCGNWADSQLPLISQELTHALHSEKPYAETRTSERHNPRLRRNQLWYANSYVRENLFARTEIHSQFSHHPWFMVPK